MTAKKEKEKPQLTRLTKSGGCGCKISASRLQTMLAGLHYPPAGDLLMAGADRDDAAVLRLSDNLAIVSSVDFFTPIVDEPYDFGRIAAANALSDIYAMGGRPIIALNVLGVPLDKMSDQQVADMLAGGAERCRQAGIPVAGGHSVRCAEPVYGLAVNGALNPACMKTNAGAQAGDALILGKPLGVGVLSAALRAERLDAAAYQSLIDNATLLNTAGIDFAELKEVHAMTDVTGFGLLGHLLEVCMASQVDAHISLGDVPLLEAAVELARQGLSAGATQRNLHDVRRHLVAAERLNDQYGILLSDPQTSGGLLVSCAEQAAEKVLSVFRRHACAQAAVIGHLSGQRGERPATELAA